MAAPPQYDAIFLTIAVAYGGRKEIVHAVRSSLEARAGEGDHLPAAIERITPEAVGRYLYAADLPDPDLIIEAGARRFDFRAAPHRC